MILTRFAKLGDRIAKNGPQLLTLNWVRLRHIVWRFMHSPTDRHRFYIGAVPRVVNGRTRQEIRVSHPARLLLYYTGIERRKEDFLMGYGLNTLNDQIKDGIVIDVGANCGELGVFLPPLRTYLGIDPDPGVRRSFEINNPNAQLISQAASDCSGTRMIYLATATGDTGFHSEGESSARSMEVRLGTLDSLVENELGTNPLSIDLIKVEAEGHEPEVLRGSEHSLAHARYVAIDFGPERNGEWTKTECEIILGGYGFEMIILNGNRALFKNKHLS